MQADGVEIVSPKQLIIPDITKLNKTADLVSGSLYISGSTMLLWMGKWIYLSGSQLWQPM